MAVLFGFLFIISVHIFYFKKSRTERKVVKITSFPLMFQSFTLNVSVTNNRRNKFNQHTNILEISYFILTFLNNDN